MSNTLRDRIDETPEDTSVPPPPSEQIETPDGFELREDGVWCSPKPKKTKAEEGDDEESTAPYLISGPCWVSAESRRYDASQWGLQVFLITKDGQKKERNFAQFDLSRSTQSARDLVAQLGSDGLLLKPGYEGKVVTYLRSFQSSARRLWTDQIGWLESDEMVFVLPQGHDKGGVV